MNAGLLFHTSNAMLMEFALALIVKSTVILFLTIIILRITGKKSAGFRHWIISTAILILLALPILMATLPPLRVKVLPAPTSDQRVAQPQQIIHVPIQDQVYTTVDKSTSLGTPSVQKIEPPTIETTASTVPATAAISWSTVLLSTWLLGFLIIFFRTGLGLYALQIRYRQASILELDQFPGIRATVEKIGISGSLQICTHPHIRTPMTWSSRKAIVLLPTEILQWSSEELDTVVRHELMHVRRKDFLLHLLGLLALAIYWFHPLQWWLNRRYLLEREKACDEAVIHSGVNQVTYAEQLRRIAGKLLASRPSRRLPALQMAQASMVKKRILAALRVPVGQKRMANTTRSGVLTAGLLMLPLLATLSPDQMPALDHFPVLHKLKRGVIPTAPAALQTVATTETRDIPENLPIWDTSFAEPEVADPMFNPEITKMPSLLTGTLQTVSHTERKSLEFQPLPMEVGARLFGKWKKGRRQFSVWIKGAFDLYPETPYLTARTPEDLIIIEEQKGNRTFRLVISRAAYDGALIQSYANGKANSWSGIAKGENLYLPTVDGEWKFLNRGLENWMEDARKEVMLKLQDAEDPVWQSINSDDNHWRKFVADQESFRNLRFIRKEDALNRDAFSGNLADKGSLKPFPVQLDKLLVRGRFLESFGDFDRKNRIGSDRPTQVTSGWSGGQGRGMRYGVVIPNRHGAARLNTFQFHLRHNLCGNATLRLYFYELDDQQVTFQLSDKPIYVETGERTGWINRDLQNLDMYVKKDILVVIEVISYEGKGREKGGLFFSQGVDSKNPGHELLYSHTWDFTFIPLAAYFDIQTK